MPQEPDPFALTETQQARLLACRAAWSEGEDEEYLQRLRQKAEDADTLRGVARLLEETDFARGGPLNYAQCARLLSLVRALASNPNLDARLLRRPDEPETLNRDLRDLLYGPASAAARLRNFLARRHAGGQTALQLLCAVFPDEWPLITPTGTRALDITPAQRGAALAAARLRFDLPPAPQFAEAGLGLPDSDLVLRLLADAAIYSAVRDLLRRDGADIQYVELHRLLTQGLADRPRRPRRLFSFPEAAGRPSPRPASIVREAAPSYGPQLAEAPVPDFAPPDTEGIFHRDALAQIENYVAAQGFTYPELALRDYYIALQTKPFALISGITGVGKTRLTSLFAEALTGAADAQYRLLPVRPDWSDSAPLLGYVNLLAPGLPAGRYVPTPFTEFLGRATQPENAHRAYFLCLDELNLARVEHYMAEILSAMETPTRELLLPDGRVLRLPPNFFLSGTLNLDEATYSLSRKVLDRANLFIFDEVCLLEEKGIGVRVSGVGTIPGSLEDSRNPSAQGTHFSTPDPRPPIPFSSYQAVFLQHRAATVAAARRRLAEIGGGKNLIGAGEHLAEQIVETLAAANQILQPQGLHFAYRVRDEVLRYCANSFDRDGMGLLVPERPEDVQANLKIALDLQLLQKVLPRFSGGREQIETPLRNLLAWTEAERFGRSARKIARLLARLQRDDFVAFDAI